MQYGVKYNVKPVVPKLVDKIGTQFQGNVYVSRYSYSVGSYQLSMLYDVTGSEKFKMAFFKAEVPISQLESKDRNEIRFVGHHIGFFTSG